MLLKSLIKSSVVLQSRESREFGKPVYGYPSQAEMVTCYLQNKIRNRTKLLPVAIYLKRTVCFPHFAHCGIKNSLICKIKKKINWKYGTRYYKVINAVALIFE